MPEIDNPRCTCGHVWSIHRRHWQEPSRVECWSITHYGAGKWTGCDCPAFTIARDDCLAHASSSDACACPLPTSDQHEVELARACRAAGRQHQDAPSVEDVVK